MTDQQEQFNDTRKKKRVLIWVTAFFCMIALGIFLWWVIWARFVESTKDSYVHGNQVILTPQVAGIVTAVHVNETDFVQEGQILVNLDETDRKIALESSKSHLAETVRTVTTMFENVYMLAAKLEMCQAELFSAEIDYLDRKQVVTQGAVSDEEYIHAESKFYSAKASVQAIKFQLMQAISMVQNTTVRTHPLIEHAKEGVKQAWVNLQRCTLRAPATGVVAQRRVQVGESVTTTSPLLAVVPLDQMWINANFKETDLSKIRIGQSVTMTADMYGGGVIFHGQVEGINSGSGAVFSPLPAQNATGNWIKIVQRIPVRISINQDQLRRFPLWLGLSMQVHVDIREVQGPRVSAPKKDVPLYVTTVFQDQLQGVESMINEVIEQHSTFDLQISEQVLLLVGK